MDLRGYLRAIRKHWLMVVGALAIGLAVAGLVALTTTPTYSSSVTFFVNTPSDTIAGSAQGDTFGQKRVNSYVQLITTSSLVNMVATELGDGMSPAEIGATISAKGDLNTVLLTATITDTSPERSLRIATAVSTEFVKLVSGIETGQSATPSTVRLEVVDGPALDPSPVEPRVGRDIGLGLLVGLIIGIGLAILRDVLDTSLRTEEDLQKVAGVPVMGTIFFDEQASKNPVILGDTRQSIRSEAFRQLRTNLQFVNAAAPVRTLVVTSSVSGEGKSTTATNIAISFADAGQKVLLIEGDLRRPRVADYLGIEGSVGLTNVLIGQVAIAEVLQSWGGSTLTVLASGSIPPNPSEMLGSAGMIELLESLKGSFDLIVIDTPPLLPVTDAAILATYADGAIVVARHGSTKRLQLAASIKSLRAVDARILGCVLNMAPTKGADAYGYGYGYGYYQSDDHVGSRSKLDPMVVSSQAPDGPRHADQSELDHRPSLVTTPSRGGNES
ncbi:MAG: polysaccharide biosynthesis tyrosine autokinase [Nakamurella sp.]